MAAWGIDSIGSSTHAVASRGGVATLRAFCSRIYVVLPFGLPRVQFKKATLTARMLLDGITTLESAVVAFVVEKSVLHSTTSPIPYRDSASRTRPTSSAHTFT